MSRGAQGRLLLVLGGALLVAGALWPELQTAAHNALVPAAASPPPDRSHWFILREDLDMLAIPDPESPGFFTAWYAVQALGLAWLICAGAAFALAALLPRSRLVALVCALFHGGAFVGLAAGVTFVFTRLPPPQPGKPGLVTLGPVLLLWALAAGEALLASRALMRGGAWRLSAVDTAGVLPLVLLFLAHAGLYAALHGHQAWPASGYLVGAIGGALALLGMQRRLVPRG